MTPLRYVPYVPWRRVVTPWTLTLSAPMLVAILDPAQASAVTLDALTALMGTLPYIGFAVLLIAALKATGAEAVTARLFQGREVPMILMAALFGGLAPFCSCEVIPFIASLLALGAPLSAVMAFWLSSPLIDPATLVITASVLGWTFALGKTAAAIALGLFGGFTVMALSHTQALKNPLRPDFSSSCGCQKSSPPPRWRFWHEPPRRQTFALALKSNTLFLVKWMALAYTLEALLITYVPAQIIVSAVGGQGFDSITIAALLGMPAYLNAYASVPLLAGLMEQGMGLGAAMAFMVAGPVSSIPAMAAVWSLVRTPVFALYIALGLTGAILAGVLFQTALTL